MTVNHGAHQDAYESACNFTHRISTAGDNPASALIAAVRSGDRRTVQRILRRPDLAQIAVTLAEWHAGPKPLQPCGTRSAAERHLANGEPLDAACLAARRKYYRERPRTQRHGEAAPSVDPLAIERRLDGDLTVRLTRAERAAAIRQLDAAGHTPAAIARRLHMSGGDVLTVLGRAA